MVHLILADMPYDTLCHFVEHTLQNYYPPEMNRTGRADIAAMSLVSKDLRDATVPVLFESVVIPEARSISKWGFTSTKYTGPAEDTIHAFLDNKVVVASARYMHMPSSGF